MQNDFASFRILDANLNRAFEALRTLEDISRFRDLAPLQIAYKSARHRLQLASATWDHSRLLQARNASDDVGKDQKTDTESQRGSMLDVATAASHRIQQSLRVLEEVGKVSYPDSSREIERIRYESYDWNAQLLLGLRRDHAFLNNAQLYVLIDCRLSEWEFAKRVTEVANGGADLLQIRDKTRDAKDLLRFAEIAMQSINSAKTRVIINDRADVAQSSATFGLHLGQTDLPVSAGRKIIEPQMVLGLSTHNTVQVLEAISLGVDYVGCGPTFPSDTKPFTEFSGVNFLQNAFPILENAKLPGFAIGGIRLENLNQVFSTGFRRVAVSAAIWNDPKPGEAASRFKEQLVAIDRPN
jgi:thiamine-phosphate pyrophosphorylase